MITAWALKNTTFGFLHFLIKLGLTTRQVPQADVQRLIRRFKTICDKSSEPSPSFYYDV